MTRKSFERVPLAALNKSEILEKSRNSDVRPMTTAAVKRSQKWGVEGYYVPGNDWLHERPHTFWSNSKKENVISIEARKRKDLPPPTLYQ